MCDLYLNSIDFIYKIFSLYDTGTENKSFLRITIKKCLFCEVQIKVFHSLNTFKTILFKCKLHQLLAE